MPLPDQLSEGQWKALLGNLDARISGAIERRIHSRRYSADDIAAGFSELARLRDGGEPDYTLPGIEVAYAFKYLPQRVAGVIGALMLARRPLTPRQVLDIGSGSDAVSIALELLSPNTAMRIVSIDSSSEMRGFAELIAEDDCKERQRIAGDYGRLGQFTGKLGEVKFDLVFLSAALPYRARGNIDLTRDIARLTQPPALVAAIEPESKKYELVRLGNAFAFRLDYRVEDYCCHDMPDLFRTRHVLPLLTQGLRKYARRMYASPYLRPEGLRFLGRGPFPVESWNPSRRELVTLCFDEDRSTIRKATRLIRLAKRWAAQVAAAPFATESRRSRVPRRRSG